MNVTKKQDLLFLKLFGGFFIIILLFKLYFKDSYTLDVWVAFVLILIPLLIMVTAFWHQKISNQKIEVSFGSIFFTKNIVYTNLQSIELYIAVGSTDGPSVVNSLDMSMKCSDRKELVGLFINKSWRKCSSEEVINEIKGISKITGVSVINATPQFKSMFQRQFNKEFSLL